MQKRLIIILHPNRSRVDVVFNDHNINQEQYTFRQTKADSEEVAALRFDLERVIGVSKVGIAKNTIDFEVSDVLLPSEYLPGIVNCLTEYRNLIRNDQEDFYSPDIYVENRRYSVSPEYDSEGWQKTSGTRQGEIDVGIQGVIYNQYN